MLHFQKAQPLTSLLVCFVPAIETKTNKKPPKPTVKQKLRGSPKFSPNPTPPIEKQTCNRM